MKAKKGHPLILPSYEWTGETVAWAGRLIEASRLGDLPVAWFRPQLEHCGASVWRTPTPAPVAVGKPIRPPCVFLCDESLVAAALTPERLARLDALGVICASVPGTPEKGDYQASMLVGFPSDPADGPDPRTAFEPDRYVGGRVYVAVRGLDPTQENYFASTFVYDPETYDYTAPIGTVEQCALYGYDPGTFTQDVTENLEPRSMTTTAIAERIAEDTALFRRHVERYGAFRMLQWSDREIATISVTESVVCYDPVGLVDVLVPEGPTIEFGNDQGIEDAIVAAMRELYAELSQWVEVREPPPSAAEILDAAIAFFEADE